MVKFTLHEKQSRFLELLASVQGLIKKTGPMFRCLLIWGRYTNVPLQDWAVWSFWEAFQCRKPLSPSLRTGYDDSISDLWLLCFSGGCRGMTWLFSDLIRWLLHHWPEGQRLQIQDRRRLSGPYRTGAIKGTGRLRDQAVADEMMSYHVASSSVSLSLLLSWCFLWWSSLEALNPIDSVKRLEFVILCSCGAVAGRP